MDDRENLSQPATVITSPETNRLAPIHRKKVALPGEVVSGMIGTDPHLVVAKDHVHAPVQTVVDAPVQANALIHALSVRWQTA
jgi:hypothetical protein